MKIFISWSGQLSHKIAVILREWLPKVIPCIEPYVSSEDLNKGDRWSSEIAKELEKASFGILCVVPANFQEPWINFEAGALSKSVKKGKVAPFLFGLTPEDIAKYPIAQFQCTKFEKSDVQKLLYSINKTIETSPLKNNLLNTAFENLWPNLESHLRPLTRELSKTKAPQNPTTTKSKTLEKIQETILLELHKTENKGLNLSELEQMLNISHTRCRYHVEKLESMKYLFESSSFREPSTYFLDSKGDAYLVENNLIN